MTPLERSDATVGSVLNAELSAVEIDVRCATVLARIALRTLIEVCPEAEEPVCRGLEAAIDDARLEAVDGAEAVVGLLNEVRDWLKAERARVVYIET